jgi:hypothetical protein
MKKPSYRVWRPGERARQATSTDVHRKAPDDPGRDFAALQEQKSRGRKRVYYSFPKYSVNCS